jgi:hypothetical protein
MRIENPLPPVLIVHAKLFSAEGKSTTKVASVSIATASKARAKHVQTLGQPSSKAGHYYTYALMLDTVTLCDEAAVLTDSGYVFLHHHSLYICNMAKHLIRVVVVVVVVVVLGVVVVV